VAYAPWYALHILLLACFHDVLKILPIHECYLNQRNALPHTSAPRMFYTVRTESTIPSASSSDAAARDPRGLIVVMDGNLCWVPLANVMRACDHHDNGPPLESAHTKWYRTKVSWLRGAFT
jgi:hypothetical protein